MKKINVHIIAMSALLVINSNMFGASDAYVALLKEQYLAEQISLQEKINAANTTTGTKWAQDATSGEWKLIPQSHIGYTKDEYGFHQPYFLSHSSTEG